MNLSSNYFEIFNLATTYKVDGQLLEERYLQLQRQFHPDRYASRSAQEQRVAVQSAAAVNQAYTTLRTPIKRAQYLLELVDAKPQDSNTISDSDFLYEQMALRESIAELREATDPMISLKALEEGIDANLDLLQGEFADRYDRGDMTGAADTLAKMQFYSKLMYELDETAEELEL